MNDKDDSKTLGAQRRSRFTDRLNIRADPETKEAIYEFARQSGLSLCQIYDALTKAFLYGIQVKTDLGTQSPTINLTIERQVSRVRRYAVEPVGEVVIEERGSYSECCLCGAKPVVEAFYWADDVHCSRVYYCKGHWSEQKPRGGFSGFRQI